MSPTIILDTDEGKPRKRGRPPKPGKPGFSESPSRTPYPPSSLTQTASAPPVQTPQLKNAPLPQSSPPRATPAKATVLKALPTVRDHTTDQLNPEGDEYLPRETDDAGETKVTRSPLTRGLRGRHLQMIAIGGSIGKSSCSC